jgi:uncharacterized protein YecT (DUF1311 family)
MIRRKTLLAAITVWPLVVFADPSLECSLTSGSQVETGNCLAAVETTTAEALSVVLGFAEDAAKELDDVTGRAVTLPALQASQTAWEAWRKEECDYAGALFGGGSGTGIAIQSCRISLTRDRIELLYARLR